MAKNTIVNAINTANYEEMSVKELRAICKSRDLTGYSHMVKTSLIAMLEDDDAAKTAVPAVVIGEAQEIPEDIFDAIDGAQTVAPVAQEIIECVVPMVEEPDLSEYADGEVVPACFTDDPVVAPEKESEAKANKESFKGVTMKNMSLEQLKAKMEADIKQFVFIEDESKRRCAIGSEIVASAKAANGFIDRNVLESIIAKYYFGLTGYLILKKNNIVSVDVVNKVNTILAELLKHWVLETKVLSVAALRLRERVEGAGCKGKGYRHKDCTHPTCAGYKVWQETSPTEWNAVIASNKYQYMVFVVNTIYKKEDKASEETPVSVDSKDAFRIERHSIWARACKALNGFVSRTVDRCVPYSVPYAVQDILKINGTWVAKCSSDGITDFYVLENGKFVKCAGDMADIYQQEFAKRNR